MEQKSLSAAMMPGPDQWLMLAGLGAADEISIKPTSSEYSYRIIVPDLAIVGEFSADVQPVYQAWISNPTLLEASKSLDTLRRHLLAVPDIERARVEKLEAYRQALEWGAFGGAKSGAKIPLVAQTGPAAAWINRMISSDFGTMSGLTAVDRLDWLTLLRGRSLDAPDFKFFLDQLPQIAIPGSYERETGEADLLKIFSLASVFSPPQDRVLPLFYRLRGREKLDFKAAMRQAAYKVGGEEMWTTGQPELAAFRSVKCQSISGLDDEKRAKLDYSQLRVDSLMQAQLDANTRLMSHLNGYAGRTLDPGLVKVFLDDEDVCFARFNGAKEVERRRTSIDSLTREFVEPYKGLRLVADDPDVADALKEKGIVSSSFDNIGRELSVKAYTKRENSKEKTFRRFNRSASAEGGFDMTTLNLETKGDALIVRLPDGTLLMVDTGLGEDTFSKLSDFLKRNYKLNKPALRLVITHSHKDHIGGLRKIANEGFEIQEMLIGRSLTDGNAVDQLFVAPTKGRKADRRPVANPAGRTDIKDGEMPGVTHFVKDGVAPLFNAGARRVSRFGEVESWSLKSISDVQIDVHHVIRAREPNEGGLLVRLGYHGMHWLLADDLEDPAWAAMLRNLSADDLSAGVLKWPHHLWFPRENETTARSRLERIIRRINPHTILFSNTGHTSHDTKRFKEIKEFAARVLPGVRTEWTRENGKHLFMQAELESRGPVD